MPFSPLCKILNSVQELTLKWGGKLLCMDPVAEVPRLLRQNAPAAVEASYGDNAVDGRLHFSGVNVFSGSVGT